MVEFENGATATHNMIGGAARGIRTMHIVGTRGEIQGVQEDGFFTIRCIDPRPGQEHSEERVDVDDVDGPKDGTLGAHGVCDMQTMADFIRLMRNEPRSISCTSLDDSIHGHQMVFCADRAMESGEVVVFPEENEQRIPQRALAFSELSMNA